MITHSLLFKGILILLTENLCKLISLVSSQVFVEINNKVSKFLSKFARKLFYFSYIKKTQLFGYSNLVLNRHPLNGCEL